jgi:dihydroorotate dehydrogenase
VPDWTYHPLFKPLLFRLPADWGRRITLRLLAWQASTSPGRALFRMFAHVECDPASAVKAFGVRFPSPVGLGAGIDTHGVAMEVMQYLGFGFLELGPCGARARPRRYDTQPRRIDELAAIVDSQRAAAPASAALARRIREARALEIPVGIALSGEDVEAALADVDGAAFVTLPESCGRDPDQLARLRAATRTPLLLRLSPDWDDATLDEVVEAAVSAGLDGFVAVAGQATDVLPEGRLQGRGSAARALALVRRVAASSDLPIIGCGGIGTPEQARAFLDAGATLVSLYDGLVFAGPGLPARILAALHEPPASDIDEASPAAAAAVPRWSWWMVAFTGLVLIFAGLFMLFLAATDHMLPPDVAFLGMNATELCGYFDCRIVKFMVHDRVSFAGAILNVGVVYLWLAASPLRNGEAWAWWALVISGGLGFSSFLTYLGYGYLDPWHAAATLLLLPWFVIGLIGSYRHLAAPRSLSRALRRFGAPAWRWSPAGMGRMAVGFAGFGMFAGGLTIMVVGMTRVFVPQDLDYMHLTLTQIGAVNPRLVPLIAHDRAGFGGGLCSGGVAVMAALIYGLRPGRPGLWLTMLIGGVVGFSTTISVHFIVGYTDFFHLLPAYAGAVAFAWGVWLLYRPMCRLDGERSRFPDY